MSGLIIYIFIFTARIADVSLDVVRLLMLARGYAKLAACIGFVEVSIYVVALGSVISGGFKDVYTILAYAAGFATGNLVGIFIEGKMAIGYVVVQMFPDLEHTGLLTERLRDSDFGVTQLVGEGKTGPRTILVVTAKRKDQQRILQIMNEVVPDIFFNVSDVRSLRGGVFPSPVR